MLAIRVGTLIDGHGGEPLSDAVVLVDGDKISQVSSAQEVEIPPGAEVLDAGDKTLLPGLVDAHVHIHTPGGPSANYALAEAREFEGTIALRAYSYGLQSLRMGFTSLRSMASPGLRRRCPAQRHRRGYRTGSSSASGGSGAEPHRWAHGQALLVTGGDDCRPYRGLRRTLGVPQSGPDPDQVGGGPYQDQCLRGQRP